MQTYDPALLQQSLHNAQADVTAACERILQLESCLDDFMNWAGALALTGIPTPESWTLLNKVMTNATLLLTPSRQTP